MSLGMVDRNREKAALRNSFLCLAITVNWMKNTSRTDLSNKNKLSDTII